MVQGENGLHYKAEFDINEFKKNADELLQKFKQIQAEGDKAFNFKPGKTGIDTKPITAFQQANIDLKKVLLEASVATEKLRQENLILAASLKAGRITQQQAIATERENRIERQNLTRATKDARIQQAAANGSYNEAQARLKELSVQIRSVTGGFNAQGAAQKARIEEYRKLNSELTAFDEKMGNHQRKIGNYGGALKGAAADLAGMASAYLSAGAALQYVLTSTMAFQKIKTPLTYILGSEGEASSKLDELKKLAGELGLEYFALAASYKSFTAAARASNFDLVQSEKIFTSVTKASAVLGLSSDQLEGALMAIQQMISKGNVQAEELRGQLAERLPGAFALAAKAMGVTEKELNKLLETGQVLAADLLPKLADQLDKQYGDKAADGIKGLNAEWQKLISLLQSTAGESDGISSAIFEPILKGAQSVVTFLNNSFRGSFTENFRYAFSLFNSTRKELQAVYDLRSSNKNNKSALQGAEKRDLSGSGLAELKNYYTQVEQTFRKAAIDYETFKKGIADGTIKESTDASLASYARTVEGLAAQRNRVAVEIVKQKELIKKGSKEVKDVALTSVADIRKEITRLSKVDGSAVVGSEANQQLQALKEQLKKATSTSAGSSAKADESALKGQRNLQAKIDEINNAAKRKQETSDNEELQAVKDKYAKIAKEIATFNATHKGKYKVDTSGLVKSEEKETETVLAKQAVETQKNSINEQKALFNEYEQYKYQVGTTEANRRFAADIKGFKSYVDYLKSLLPADSDTSVYANKMRDLVNKDLLPAANNEAIKRQEEQFTELLKATETFQQAATSLTEKYEAKRASIQNDRFNVLNKQENLKVLDAQYKEEMDALINSENAKADFTKRLAQEAMVLTRAQIKQQIEALVEGFSGQEIPDSIQRVLDNLKGRLRIGPDQVNNKVLEDREKDIISALGAEIEETTPKFTELLRQLEEVRKKKKALDSDGNGKSNSGLGGFLSDLGDGDKLLGMTRGLSMAADASMMLSDSLGGVDTKAGYTLDTIGKLAGAAGDLGASILSGDPAKIIGSAIKAVETLFSIGRKVKEMNAAARKEVADFYAQAITGEREYQDLLRQRQIENVRNNKIVLQGIRDEVALRKTQAAEYDKEAAEIMKKLQGQNYVAGETYKHGTWFRKAQVNKTYTSLNGKNFEQLSQLLAQGKLEGDAKALVERLKELEQKGYDADQAMAELAKTTAEIFTGITADNLTDSLAQMFAEGKTGAADLADFFKQSMDDAALSIFKNKVLAQAMEDFYKKFDTAAQSDDKLTDTEIAALQLDFQNMTDDALKRFDEYKKITGSDLTGGNSGGSSNQNALTSSMKNIKQESFKELTSLLCQD